MLLKLQFFAPEKRQFIRSNLFRLMLMLLLLVGKNAHSESDTSERQQTLNLTQAVYRAIENDPWLTANRHNQQAIESMSIAAGTLPDPKMSIGLMNIGADSFDFDQQDMTQLSLGVSQSFARGDSLALKQKQLSLTASQYPLMRQDRKARVAVMVAKLWLDAYQAQQSVALIENNRDLFEQLADVAQASYSSAIGKTRQQDIVRAQLELTRLDDRLTQLKQKKQTTQQQLFEWFNQPQNGQQPMQTLPAMLTASEIRLDQAMPNIKMLQSALYISEKEADPNLLFHYFSTHPLVGAVAQKIKASETEIDLAKQQYRPEWGVSANYGYRDNAPTGMDRADLFSIGVSFDLPLFTNNRQDKQVAAAVSQTAAIKTEKWLLVRQLIAQFEAGRAHLVGLTQRQMLYQQRLLPQMHDQAEASLTAYTHDDGDFAEVVRARIAELNAQIDALDINVERQKAIIALNYLFMKNAIEIIAADHQSNSTLEKK